MNWYKQYLQWTKPDYSEATLYAMLNLPFNRVNVKIDYSGNLLRNTIVASPLK